MPDAKIILPNFGDEIQVNCTSLLTNSYPPASEASREIANLTERKNPHTPRI